MILQKLCEYYERLDNDPEVDDIAKQGYSLQSVSFKVVLEEDGSLFAIEDMREQVGKSRISKKMVLCGNAKPSGTGFNPCFLWDNTRYLLGYKLDDDNPERTLKCFEAFRNRQLETQSLVHDKEYDAVCSFLKNWSPNNASKHEVLLELGTGFGVFQIRGQMHYVHEQPKVVSYYEANCLNSEAESVDGQCLVTGDKGPIARLHEPQIKGLRGAQPAGAGIVSFNLDASKSYGKAQGYNSPVSKTAAFKYSTALNHLIDQSNQRVMVTDTTTTVFWTEKPCAGESLFSSYLNGQSSEDEGEKKSLEAALASMRNGKMPTEDLGDLKTPFYVLGLSPNAARVAVRYWMSNTLGEMLDNLKKHIQDMSLVKQYDKDPDVPMIWQLMYETAREAKEISPVLAGPLVRAILSGGIYPDAMCNAILRRIRVDKNINYIRCSFIKAYLTRKFYRNSNLKELPVALDENREETSYQLGRLFSVLEKAQEDVMPGANATIKDRFFGSASTTPQIVFPRLIKLNQHHMRKMENVGQKIYIEKKIQSIASAIDVFPSFLNLKDQGLFCLGYYHQRKDLFTKRKDAGDK